jgi:hypothetical protein
MVANASTYKIQAPPVKHALPAKTQGTPGCKPKKWVTQRELGRMFGLNLPKMGKKLFEMGWRNEKGIPHENIIESGLARMVPVPLAKYAQVPSYRWHANKVAAHALAYGLVARSQEEIYIHAVIDKVATQFRRSFSEMKRTGRTRQSLEQEGDWEDPVNNYLVLGIIGEVKSHLDIANHNDAGVLVDGLIEGLRTKKISDALLNQMLARCGLRDAYDARAQARLLEEVFPQASARRSAHRL